MWKIKTIFIFVLLMVPLTVRAAEPTDYRCVCGYKQEGANTNECSKSEEITTNLSEGWNIELKKTNFFGQPGQYDVVIKTAKGIFNNKDDCSDLLESATGAGVICGGYNCYLEAELSKDTILPNGSPGKQKYWEKWYNLKWVAINTKDNPVPVKEGEIGTADVIVSGATAVPITIECLNCDEYGAKTESKEKGKFKIIWDTSQSSEVYTKLYAMQVKASIGGADEGALLGDVYFSVTGVSSVQTTSTVDAWIKSQYGVPPGYVERGGALPPCAFSGSCRSVNDLLQLIINFASGLFAILGTFAFAFFVYGGFKMIMSVGNAEMVETGKKTMIAAALGLVVAFSAYMAIDLMLA
ncbi:MAG: hypothetical protein HZC26_00295 [Candidatus Magasanikbacteria bacterium]|nr:hypothetical protein [Candidatus Magasanikbacteria bacterium]